MKKLISILLSLILLLSVTACSDKNDGSISSNSSGNKTSGALHEEQCDLPPTYSSNSTVVNTREDLPQKSLIAAHSQDNAWAATYKNYMALSINEAGDVNDEEHLDFTILIHSKDIVVRPLMIIKAKIIDVEIEDETIAAVSAKYVSSNEISYKITGLKAGKTTATATVISSWPSSGEYTVGNKTLKLPPIECKFDLYVFEE